MTTQQYNPEPANDRIVLALETYARHMTDEGNQLQCGLETAGYALWGKDFPNDEADVRKILDQTNPSTIVVQDKRDWDPNSGGCFDPSVAFTNLDALADRHDIFKLTIVKDAHSSPPHACKAYAEIGCNAWITYYHADTVMQRCPWLRREHLVRTYHSLSTGSVPIWRPASERKQAILSGALDGDWSRGESPMAVYPLRGRIARAIVASQIPDIDFLPHPGYHAKGSATPDFLKTLSQYKVSICTASIYGYALRKIIESTACGNVVITDLPEKDELPFIDGNLHRISSNTQPDEVAVLARELSRYYNEARQLAFARHACDYYNYPSLYGRLAQDIETLRVSYKGATPL